MQRFSWSQECLIMWVGVCFDEWFWSVAARCIPGCGTESHSWSGSSSAGTRVFWQQTRGFFLASELCLNLSHQRMGSQSNSLPAQLCLLLHSGIEVLIRTAVKRPNPNDCAMWGGGGRGQSLGGSWSVLAGDQQQLVNRGLEPGLILIFGTSKSLKPLWRAGSE